MLRGSLGLMYEYVELPAIRLKDQPENELTKTVNFTGLSNIMVPFDLLSVIEYYTTLDIPLRDVCNTSACREGLGRIA